MTICPVKELWVLEYIYIYWNICIENLKYGDDLSRQGIVGFAISSSVMSSLRCWGVISISRITARCWVSTIQTPPRRPCSRKSVGESNQKKGITCGF